MDFFEYAYSSIGVIFQYGYNFKPVSIFYTALLVGAITFALVYVFQSIALFIIGRREGYKHPWMAFVPILNGYYMGVCSQKNRLTKFNGKQVGIVYASVELVVCILYTIYFVAFYQLLSQGYLQPYYQPQTYFGETIQAYQGLTISEFTPVDLAWAEWVCRYLYKFFLSWTSLVYLFFRVIIIILFFKTYSCRNYIVFSILSVFFPLLGIFAFAVRNNRARDYSDYVREMRERQYRMYHEYNRMNMNNTNYGGTDTGRPEGGNPYGGSQNVPPDDPFSEFSTGKSNPPDDPFGDS